MRCFNRTIALFHLSIRILQYCNMHSFFHSSHTFSLPLSERLLKLVLVKLDLYIEPVTICDQFTLVFILRPQIVTLKVLLFIVYKGSV